MNFSEKRLISSVAKKGRHHNPFSSHRLEIYAFWTGLLSTVISLLETIVIALKK